MAQWAKSQSLMTWVRLPTPHGRREDPTPTSCLLASTCKPWHEGTPMHTCTHRDMCTGVHLMKKKNKITISKQKKKWWSLSECWERNKNLGCLNVWENTSSSQIQQQSLPPEICSQDHNHPLVNNQQQENAHLVTDGPGARCKASLQRRVLTNLQLLPPWLPSHPRGTYTCFPN